MKNKTAPIIVEKLGVSDDYYTITKLFCENGSEVKENQLILCIESSKASEDIVPETFSALFDSEVDLLKTGSEAGWST